MTRPEFVRNIENGGKYSGDYHVRVINGVKTPCSNPDGSKGNNLDRSSPPARSARAGGVDVQS